jgi:hypothetical protein
VTTGDGSQSRAAQTNPAMLLDQRALPLLDNRELRGRLAGEGPA